jgi:hypothetical protein
MTETVRVEAGGTTTGTTATEPTGTGTTPGAGGTSTGGSYPAPGPDGSSGGSTAPSPNPLAGARLGSVSSLPGGRVRASVEVPAAAAGGTLEAELLASRAELARRGGGASVVLARLRRSPLAAGRFRFSLRAGARAHSALARHRHLAVTLKVLLRLPGGSPGTLGLTRRVLLRG